MFSIEVVIANKPQARDPEGETIMRDLVHKNGLDCVEDIRTGKLLAVKVRAGDEEEARKIAVLMCNDLRLYNPVAHTLNVRVMK